eukprot:Sdes_comp15744_c0_seq2m4788
MGKSTHGIDGLIGQIVFSGGVILDDFSIFSTNGISNSINLLVHFCTVMISVLTRTRNCVLDTTWMPSSNTSNLSQTLVGFPGQFLGAPTMSNTFESMTLGDTDDINHFRVIKNSFDWNLLLKVFDSKVDFISHGTSVDLNLHNVSFLLGQLALTDLSVTNSTNNRAVLFHARQFRINCFFAFSTGPLLGVFGESFLLAGVPVFVKSSFTFITNVLSKHSGECSQSTRSLDVPNNSNTNHGRSLYNSDGLHNFLLVRFGTGPVHFSNNVSHTSFVADESSQVTGFAGIITRKGFDFSLMTFRTPFGEKSQRTVARGFKFTVRL